ncbi:MAG: hypothetical protein CMI61_02875 [Parvibaculum sp.]|nr:hypothetical protein [Parvibaculum sp.]
MPITAPPSSGKRRLSPAGSLRRSPKCARKNEGPLTAIATGRTIDSDFVHVITLKDGKSLRFRDLMNTAVAVAAFS